MAAMMSLSERIMASNGKTGSVPYDDAKCRDCWRENGPSCDTMTMHAADAPLITRHGICRLPLRVGTRGRDGGEWPERPPQRHPRALPRPAGSLRGGSPLGYDPAGRGGLHGSPA